MSTFTDNSKRPLLPTDAPRPGQPVGTRTTTVLTSDCEFKGALAFSGELELHGRLEGTIESEGGALTVGEQALIKAEIKVNDVLIYGKVQGNIYATGRIELRGKAEVYGDLYGKNQPAGDFAKMFTRLGATAKTNSTPAGTTPAKATAGSD